MKYFRKLEGKKIYLSPMNSSDYETYCTWINDLSNCIPLGNVTTNYTLVKEKEILEKISEGQGFAIVNSENDELLGNCSLFEINHIHRTATCGIFIGDRNNRNKGYGKEAIELLLNYGFKFLNLNNIMLKVFSFNRHGIEVYKKVGFIEIGRRTEAYFINGKYYDEVYMEILKDNFNSNLLSERLENILD